MRSNVGLLTKGDSMFELKKLKKNASETGQKKVTYKRYYNKDLKEVKKVVFKGSMTDCQSFIRAQAIEANNLLKNNEDEVILKVYRSSGWVRIELLDVGPESIDYYSTTYEIV